jgi:hypothetical protein
MNKVELKKEQIIKKVVELLKKSAVVAQMFERFDKPISVIDEAPISFADLDVSAKTKDEKIYLNNILVEEEDFLDHMHYIVHEMCHYLQQTTGEIEQYPNLHEMEYLDQPTELEAFNYQVKFIREISGEEEANKYVRDLLDFHEYEHSARDRKYQQLIK